MIELLEDEQNKQDILGKTGYYNPEDFSIGVYISGRHPKDCLRSIAHELVHHSQNCKKQIPENVETNEGYAQNNEKLRDLEKEAYETGNILFRDWEDKKK